MAKLVYSFAPSLHHRHVMDRTEQALAFNGGDVRKWQKALRKKLAEITGWNLVNAVERVPLRVKSLWKREHELGTIEKIVFTAEPKSDVPAYLCLPKNARPPYRFMVALQGHSTGMHNSIAVTDDESGPKEIKGDRDFALGCMQNGFGALCIEQRSFGERRESVQKKVAQHPCHDAVMHAMMLGRTLTAERVFDVDRGIDYLASRGDVDMDSVGVMGNSGGGVITLYAAALLPRVKFAMPSCAFCSFRDSYMSIYHCADNYIPGLLNYAEAGDLAGLFAPKPMVVVAGKTDDIFPIKGVRSEFKRLQEVYAAGGAKDRVKLVVGPEGHRFYAKQAWSALLRLIGG